MITRNRETVVDDFRAAVLKALDEAAARQFRDIGIRNAQRNDCGATDADLPELFRDIDRQIERLCARYEVVLVDYPVNTPA